MADAEVDIASLNGDQQAVLQQYTAVTDQELGAAVPLLRKCEWNVQIAIARFFDGEPDPIQSDPSPPPLPPPQTSRRTDTLASTFTTSHRRPPTGARYEPAPRLVSQPTHHIPQQPGFLLTLVLTPANLLYNLLSRIFNLVGHIFPFLPRLLSRLLNLSPARPPPRRPLGPADTTTRFLHEFTETHGTHALPFLTTGYSRAFDLAKTQLKFLLVLPIAPEHETTPSFIKEILLSPVVADYLNDESNNILLWAGSIRDSEAYQVASSLSITTFPTCAVIAHTPSVSSSAMSVIKRIVAPATPEEFVAQLAAAVRTHSPQLETARRSRGEADANRRLRGEQESAYERSLAQDRARAQRKREEQEKEERVEREKLAEVERRERYEQGLKQWRRWRASWIEAEPEQSAKDIVRVSLRLLDGQRVMRRLRPDVGIEEVYAVAECWEELNGSESASGKEAQKPDGLEHQYMFRLVSPMPRQVFDLEAGGTVKERLGRSGNLIVERIEDGEEEEEDLDEKAG